MNLTKTTSALAAALALALSGAAFGATPPPVDTSTPDQPVQAEVGFDELDKDADGFVVQSDVPPEHELALQFAVADLDQDQRLSRDEFEAYQEEPEEEAEEE